MSRTASPGSDEDGFGAGFFREGCGDNGFPSLERLLKLPPS
jgi:hypothetical protein